MVDHRFGLVTAARRFGRRCSTPASPNSSNGPLDCARTVLFRFGESRAGSPRPITVWYLPNESTGSRFIYPKTSRQLIDHASN
jgi:hypothetical protein